MQEHYVVELEGTFDLHAANRVRGVIADIPAERVVTLDFTKVGRVDDAAFALLAPALCRPGGPRVDARGLGLHHQRLWRYLGFMLPPAPPHPAETEAVA